VQEPAVDEAPVTSDDYRFVAKLLRERSAIVLDPKRRYLINARLAPLAQRHGLTGTAQLIERLRAASDQTLVDDVVEAMVTTETSFFRDTHPFETLRTSVLPELIERRRPQRQLNIWCAASSSGQEPYSLAILLREHFPELAGWRILLSGTDISRNMLERSKAARYSQVEVDRGLPPELLLKWFQQDGSFWQLDDRIRGDVTFTPMNLAKPWPAMPAWDIIFLRNVMIYFDNEMKRGILQRAARVLRKDGYLLLGGSETTLNLNASFCRIQNLRSGFYRLKP
jgi:chemotaxis protein methyltransferase CheR